MIIGIDLGTTNSLVAVWRENSAGIVPNALGDRLTPSVVGLDDNGQILVGKPARDRLITHPDLTAANFKRFMGTNKEYRFGRKRFRAEELSALVLKSLVSDVEAALGIRPAEAVVSVPAYFSDAQRKATRAAGEIAGLSVERIVNEPTAAALAFGLHLQEAEHQFLVFDLGGGTFDVSILELFDDVMEVRASAGDNYLGGEDFVRALAERFLADDAWVGPKSWDRMDLKLAQRIRNAAEKAKCALTDNEKTELTFVWQDRRYAWTATRDDFETLSQGLIARMRQPLERALRDAKIRASELDQIVLVGGATKMPMVRGMIARLFGRFPASGLDPEEVVALGAATMAGLKSRDKALREVVMADVCPYTLGVETVRELGANQYREGVFCPILERNKVIPLSRVERFQTLSHRQKAILIRVFQGESRYVKDNVFLGSLEVSVPPMPAGEEVVDIRFSYDINGLLEVEATVASTGKTRRLVIEEAPGALTQEEISASLEKLSRIKIHPRDKMANRALLARAERWHQETLGETRARIGFLMDAFNAALDEQEEEAIDAAKIQLADFLDLIEDSPF